MKNIIILLTISSLIFTTCIFAQTSETDANIVGHAKDKKTGEHIPYINIIVKGTSIGTSTDATGHFQLVNLPEGKLTLVASGVGYLKTEKTITISANKTKDVKFLMEQDVLGLEEVVVSADRNEMNRKEAPVVITSISPQQLECTQSVCLADALDFTPGLRMENNCQNCGFSQVRMNGLEGPYSQILINSRPVFSGLAGIYGLELIPAAMIDRIEVVRGGGSALFGGNAIAGTINVITKEPSRNTFTVDGHWGITGLGNKHNTVPAQDKTLNVSGSLVTDDRKSGLFLYSMIRDKAPFDVNGDGFSETALMKNTTFGFSAFHKPGKKSRLGLDYYRINEFRRGGNKFDMLPHESDITEQVEHIINGAGITYDLFTNHDYDKLSLYASVQSVNRDSYYGALQDPEAYGHTEDLTGAAGSQYRINFDKLFFFPAKLIVGVDNTFNTLHDIKLGANGKPNTTLSKQRVNTAGAFFQNTWEKGILKISVGLRYDNYIIQDLASNNNGYPDDIAGQVLIPRANMLIHLTEKLRYRLSYAMGYRAPQLYDEDLHTEASGARRIIHRNSENLTQETSHCITTSLNTNFSVGNVQNELLAEGFYTRLVKPFSNRMDTTPEEDVYEYLRINADDGAFVAGVNLELNTAFTKSLIMQSGFTFQRSEYESPQQWGENAESISRNFIRTPAQYGFMTLEWKPGKKLETAFTAVYTGPMNIPHFGLNPETTDPDELAAIKNGDVITGERLEKTKHFLDIGLRVAYTIPLKEIKLKISAGVENLLNQMQREFDSGVFRDAGYIYGPCKARMIRIGIKAGNF